MERINHIKREKREEEEKKRKEQEKMITAQNSKAQNQLKYNMSKKHD